MPEKMRPARLSSLVECQASLALRRTRQAEPVKRDGEGRQKEPAKEQLLHRWRDQGAEDSNRPNVGRGPEEGVERDFFVAG